MVYLIDPRYTHATWLTINSQPAGASNPSNGVTNPFGVNPQNTQASTQQAGAVQTGDLTAPKADDFASKFEKRLAIIQKYCEDYIVLDEAGNEIDITEIRKKYASNLEEGVKYCDQLINSFDADKVEKIVRAIYNQRIEAQNAQGKKISDEFVKAILESSTKAAKLSTSAVNVNNILDVIGTFVTNEDVKNGKVSLSQLFEDPAVAEALVSALKQKAQAFIKRDDIDSELKNEIIEKTNSLVDAKYDYTQADTDKLKASRDALVTSFMALFDVLRKETAARNDKNAKEYYGVPADFDMEFNAETDRYNKEHEAHKNRKVLNNNY